MSTPHSDHSLSDANFAKLRSIIHDSTGITIGDARKSMLVSRLRGRLREIDEPDFKSYISRVKTDAVELQELVNRVTTNKTYFYRTPRIWDHFRNVIQPDFLAKKLKRPMKVWSGAASTGEEAHTIGVLLEELRSEHPSFDYSILGTDVSSRVLEVAEAGSYFEKSVAPLKKDLPELFSKHMVGDDKTGFKVTPAIKSRIKFKLHNLQRKLKTSGRFDVVFLRNVLIYFTHEDQETILRHVGELMQPDGVLIIGESETLTQLNTGFEPVEPMVYHLSASPSEAIT